MSDFSFWDIVRNLATGLQWTLLLSLVAFVGGGVIGLLVMTMRISRKAFPRNLARTYIELFQGTPLLMQLFLVFFGIALLGVDISPWLAAAIALTLFTSAYLAEIWRGCVDSIAHGQWEASASLALNPLEQLRYVILPQALRIAVAPTVGFSVQVVKGTAVTSIIGFTELTKTGGMLANATFEPFMVYGLVFFGIALLGVDISPWLAAAIALTLFTSAYLAEIWRGCVDSIAHGQWEASASLALNPLEQLRYVILPQALRIAVAPTVGFSVQVVKGTAVTSIIGFTELTKTGGMLANATFEPFMVYGLVALGYFLLCYPLSLSARYLERRLHASA